jgi:glycoside/pentoside/hexuronide:cation symporter, GPH family
VFSTVPTVLLLYYVTETLEIAAAIAGIIILLPKLCAIFWDPFVGYRSDRSTSRWGRRRPFMVAGILGMTSAFVMLFHVPALSGPAMIAWVGITYLTVTLCYSLFAVPYIALPAELANDKSSLSQLVSGRMTFVMIGILAGASLGPWLVASGGGGRAGYGWMSSVIALSCLVIMSLPLLMLGANRDKAFVAPKSGKTPTLWADVKQVLSNAGFRKLAAAYLLQATAFGSFSAIIPYLVTKVFQRGEADIGISLGVYLIATLCAVPFWAWLGRRVGLRSALAMAILAYAAGVAIIGLLASTPVSWALSLVGFALAGIPFAGLQVLPFTLLGELTRKEGQNSEGSFSGVWTAVEKLGLALGPAFVALGLSIVGKDDPAGIIGLAMALPVILSILSLIPNKAVS